MKFASGNIWGADKALSDEEFTATDLSMNMETYEKKWYYHLTQSTVVKNMNLDV